MLFKKGYIYFRSVHGFAFARYTLYPSNIRSTDQTKKKAGFKEAFRARTGRIKNTIRLPKFNLTEIEDFFVYYVMIIGISENLFWNADYHFLQTVVENKQAFENYMTFKRQKEAERRR